MDGPWDVGSPVRQCFPESRISFDISRIRDWAHNVNLTACLERMLEYGHFIVLTWDSGLASIALREYSRGIFP